MPPEPSPYACSLPIRPAAAYIRSMKILLLPGLDGTGRLLADFAAALRREYEVEVIRYTAEQVAYSAIETWLAPCCRRRTM